MEDGSHEAALHLLKWVLAVPEPDVDALVGRPAEQGPACADRQGFDHAKRRLADAAKSDGGGDKAPDMMRAINPFARVDAGRIDPFEGRGGYMRCRIGPLARVVA